MEDLQEIREGFRGVLNISEGFECISIYSNAEDALQSLPTYKPDVVVMDINLPGISGIECILRLKEKKFEGQFMMFTVYDDDENIFAALQAGASGYILKKSTPQQFLDSISEIFNGGSPMSTHIARKVVQVFQNRNKPSKETDVLTPREKEILELLSKGFLYKEISGQLTITIGTVKQHIHKIYEKLHVQNKTDAINKFLSNRLS